MTLKDELGYSNPIRSLSHEAVLNIVLTGHLLSKTAYLMLRPFGLTDTQFNVLMLLRHQTPEGGIAQTSLGKMMLVNRSNVSGIVDRLRESGLIEVTEDAIDRRVKNLKISPEGIKLLDQVEQLYDEGVKHATSGLSEAEQKKLCGMMERIRKSVSDAD